MVSTQIQLLFWKIFLELFIFINIYSYLLYMAMFTFIGF